MTLGDPLKPNCSAVRVLGPWPRLLGFVNTATVIPCDANRRTTSAVSSVEQSSTTMKLGCHSSRASFSSWMNPAIPSASFQAGMTTLTVMRAPIWQSAIGVRPWCRMWSTH
ncbi:MAG: hypothetical protein JW395_0372 [Nitrospira sp.]|nr:hypothetical protein [Nitrospira sp.]